ncbi:putative lipoprotein [Thiothrix caldifontis]|uniref:Putative lipoprotein n=1 Tax=Thiothrix caldifontis TaxID=525918 RepID=A0A1H4FMZ2_9GAMM|nr:hypothetical protein [Thiothrix caldifontis]SEA98437.1 putative lipoprotein [Thiothrix caldifontis]
MKAPQTLQATTLLLLLLSSNLSHADEWMSKDKSVHFSVSAALGVAAYSQTHNRTKAFAWAIAPGVLKEIIDSQDEGKQFSGKDLAWDAVGAFVGVQAGHWIIGDNKIAWVKEF